MPDRLLSENAVVQDRQRSRFIVSLDTDGLGARAVVMRKDPDGTVTGLACVGHETRDGGTIASEFDPWGEGEPPEVFFTYPLSDTTRGFDAARGGG